MGEINETLSLVREGGALVLLAIVLGIVAYLGHRWAGKFFDAQLKQSAALNEYTRAIGESVAVQRELSQNLVEAVTRHEETQIVMRVISQQLKDLIGEVHGLRLENKGAE